MTKRRWLKTAIEQSKAPQVALPWSRRATADGPAIAARAPAGRQAAASA
jgi:hypothetical protein